jgi:hypothetical protein
MTPSPPPEKRERRNCMRYEPAFNIDDLESRRPVKGDYVEDGDGTLWIVEQAGMKYLNLVDPDNPNRKGFAKSGTVTKMLPAQIDTRAPALDFVDYEKQLIKTPR